MGVGSGGLAGFSVACIKVICSRMSWTCRVSFSNRRLDLFLCAEDRVRDEDAAGVPEEDADPDEGTDEVPLDKFSSDVVSDD